MLHRAPHIVCGGRIHRKPLMGKGMGSVLMSDGGAGSGSSYTSIDQYQSTTGNKVPITNLGAGLGEKLSKLIVKPIHKKPQNIKFSM